MSLYDVLHRDGIALSRHEIAFLSIQVLRGLNFLHNHGQTLGVCLTSRKVMLDGIGNVKLRRFGNEFLARRLCKSAISPPLPSESLGTMYGMVLPKPSQSLLVDGVTAADSTAPAIEMEEKEGSTSETQDLFAFGILLLEMCTGEKPTSELINKVSRVQQIDPVFYTMLMATLRLGCLAEVLSSSGAGMSSGDQTTPTTTGCLLQLLVENEQRQEQVAPDLRSIVEFSCFMHADRYFAAKQRESIAAALVDRAKHAEVMVKRLEAVESELVDEQKNFEVIVQQLERLQGEHTVLVANNKQLEELVKRQQETITSDRIEADRLEMICEDQAAQLRRAEDHASRQQKRIDTLQADKVVDANEMQKLLFEILQLKADKALLAKQKGEVEQTRDQIQSQVGSERAIVEDLEGRLNQAIHRWRDEQIARKRVEVQAEAAHKQLLLMEEERCRYLHSLWYSPTGEHDARETPAMVIELKDREVQHLHEQIATLTATKHDLEARVDTMEQTRSALESEISMCQAKFEEQHAEARSLETMIEKSDDENRTLRQETDLTRAEIGSLRQRISELEGELEQNTAAKAAQGTLVPISCLSETH